MKPTCSVIDCSSIATSKGFCGKHYQRWVIYGNPNFVKLVKGVSAKERLELNKLEVKRAYETSCWEYQGSLDKNGYGRLSFNGKAFKAHRLAYLAYIGEIPTGLQVLHKCDNTKCFRVDHLFLGTTQDNTADRVIKDRSAKGSLSGKSKLTETIVREILTTNFEYGGVIKLARSLKVSRSTIDKIIKREIWGHIVL